MTASVKVEYIAEKPSFSVSIVSFVILVPIVTSGGVMDFLLFSKHR